MPPFLYYLCLCNSELLNLSCCKLLPFKQPSIVHSVISTDTRPSPNSVISTNSRPSAHPVISTDTRPSLNSVISTNSRQSAHSVISTDTRPSLNSVISTNSRPSLNSVISTEAKRSGETPAFVFAFGFKPPNKSRTEIRCTRTSTGVQESRCPLSFRDRCNRCQPTIPVH